MGSAALPTTMGVSLATEPAGNFPSSAVGLSAPGVLGLAGVLALLVDAGPSDMPMLVAETFGAPSAPSGLVEPGWEVGSVPPDAPLAMVGLLSADGELVVAP